ncbi:MAG: c-type cytochrome domain-containing protein [Bdellovibrio sp.]
MRKLGALIIFAVGILFFQNCAVVGGSADSASEEELQAANALVLQEKAMRVVNGRCVSCHNPQNPEGQIDYLGDVNSLLYYRMIIPRDPGSSFLYQVIQSGEMPPGQPLSEEDVSAITQWINEGFNAGNPVVTPPVSETLQPQFSNIRANIFVPKCLSCHAADKAQGGVTLSSYNATRNLVVPGVPNSSTLYTAVLPGGKMAGRLTQAEIGVIRDWISAGAKND